MARWSSGPQHPSTVWHIVSVPGRGKWCLAEINLHGEAQAEHLCLGRCGREELRVRSCSGWLPADSALAGRWLLLSVKLCGLKCLPEVLRSRGCFQWSAGERFSLLPRAGAVLGEVTAAGALQEGFGPAQGSGPAPELPGAGEPGFDIPR